MTRSLQWIRFVILSLSMVTSCLAGGGAFDLLQISHLPGKGRIQDQEGRSADPQVNAILAMGKDVIPVLIDALESEKPFEKPPIDFWPRMTEGDMALIVLSDLFLDPTWRRSTLPELCWDNILERDSADTSASDLLDRFVKRHGRAELARRWRQAWSQYGSKSQWDPVGRYFRVEGRELTDCAQSDRRSGWNVSHPRASLMQADSLTRRTTRPKKTSRA